MSTNNRSSEDGEYRAVSDYDTVGGTSVEDIIQHLIGPGVTTVGKMTISFMVFCYTGNARYFRADS